MLRSGTDKIFCTNTGWHENMLQSRTDSKWLFVVAKLSVYAAMAKIQLQRMFCVLHIYSWCIDGATISQSSRPIFVLQAHVRWMQMLLNLPNCWVVPGLSPAMSDFLSFLPRPIVAMSNGAVSDQDGDGLQSIFNTAAAEVKDSGESWEKRSHQLPEWIRRRGDGWRASRCSGAHCRLIP